MGADVPKVSLSAVSFWIHKIVSRINDLWKIDGRSVWIEITLSPLVKKLGLASCGLWIQLLTESRLLVPQHLVVLRHLRSVGFQRGLNDVHLHQSHDHYAYVSDLFFKIRTFLFRRALRIQYCLWGSCTAQLSRVVTTFDAVDLKADLRTEFLWLDELIS